MLNVIAQLIGMFTLDDTENETDNENDNYGFHCNMQNILHCTETLSLMPLTTFSYFIGLGLVSVSVSLSVNTP